ncbi:MAG: 3-phosphoshikimate 1-carboxyvinyltransferase [Victivallales bacterium]|jgi:3-phosphoshikimate 1-carboxyvinyltransferase|nr:3-phosphoshikimate 1-carboxyvinyltransferase [Victivallales bacterium]
MKLRVRPSRIRGEIAVSGSKSHTIRGIIAALASSGTSRLIAPLKSDDTCSALNAAKALGAKITEADEFWEITGTGGVFTNPGHTLDLGNSGTGLRMLTSFCARQNFPIRFDGDESLRSRLMAGLFDALTLLGCEIESTNGKCPFSVEGPLRGGKTRVDGTTSQFLTSLLFMLPTLTEDSTIELDFLNEKPYIDVTLSWLDSLGISYQKSDDYLHWSIPGGQTFPPFRKVIPADFSTAAFPLCAAAIAGDEVTIRNLDFSDAQGDKKVFDFFEQMGAKIVHGTELTIAPATRKLQGRSIDLNATPDALPIMAVAAALAEGETRLLNVPQARVKETDRIAVMTSELRKMGAVIEELPDGMIIQGGSLCGAEVSSHFDHRIAMALSVAGLSARGETVIDHAEAASVTYPEFIPDFQKLGADFAILN